MFVGACVCVGLVFAFNSVNYYRNFECEIVPSFFLKTKVVCVKTCCLLGSVEKKHTKNEWWVELFDMKERWWEFLSV